MFDSSLHNIESLDNILESVEKQILIKALQSGKNNSEIAKALGINASTLSRKITKYNLRYKI